MLEHEETRPGKEESNTRFHIRERGWQRVNARNRNFIRMIIQTHAYFDFDR